MALLVVVVLVVLATFLDGRPRCPCGSRAALPRCDSGLQTCSCSCSSRTALGIARALARRTRRTPREERALLTQRLAACASSTLSADGTTGWVSSAGEPICARQFARADAAATVGRRHVLGRRADGGHVLDGGLRGLPVLPRTPVSSCDDHRGAVALSL